jgi:hypothetical protein
MGLPNSKDTTVVQEVCSIDRQGNMPFHEMKGAGKSYASVFSLA